MTDQTATTSTEAGIDATGTLESIARSWFHQLKGRARPIETRGSDREDFIEVAVAAIRDALEEAYQCGWADAEAHHQVQDAYDAGMAAGRNGNAHTTNPHPVGTPAHDLWLDGFSDGGGRIA